MLILPRREISLGLIFCCLVWSNRFQVRDQEDAEQRDVRLATDRDRHALVRVLLFGFCTRMVSMLILPRREILLMHLGLSCCCLAYSNRFQVRDQEDAAQREARLADKRHHQAVVRFVYCLQPSFVQNMSAVVNDIALHFS